MFAPSKDGEETNEVLSSLASGLLEKNEVKREIAATGISLVDIFDKSILNYFKEVWENSSNGEDGLTADEFKSLLGNYLPKILTDIIYQRIDVNDDGMVDFAEFMNFLIASEAGSNWQMTLYASKLVKQFDQFDDKDSVHRDLIGHMCFVSKPVPMLITGGKDGHIYMWNPNDLERIAEIKHKDKNSVYIHSLHNGLNPEQKAAISRVKLPPSKSTSVEKVPITAMCLMPRSSFLCVCSADCALSVYDLGTQDVVGRFPDLGEVVSTMTTFTYRLRDYDLASSAIPFDKFDNFIAVALASGRIRLLKIAGEFGTFIDAGAKKKNQLLLNQGFEAFHFKGIVHKDWVTKLMWIDEMKLLVSASHDGTIMFLDIDKPAVVRKFREHGRVVVGSFDWSLKGRYIVSAAERSVIVWDPHSLDITTAFDPLLSTVVDIIVADSREQLMALLADKTIKIWNSITFELVQTVCDNAIYHPQDTLSAMLYLPDMNLFFTASNRIAIWHFDRNTNKERDESDGDLCAVLYNSIFHQIVVVTVFGVVEVYETQTGYILRRFMTSNRVHHEEDLETGLPVPVVKHACFDKRQRRLIVTNFNGTIELWNFSNGTIIDTIEPVLSATAKGIDRNASAKNRETMSQSHYEIFHVGYKKVQRRILLVGTTSGTVFGLQDVLGEVDPLPFMHFRRDPVRKPAIGKGVTSAESAGRSREDDDGSSMSSVATDIEKPYREGRQDPPLVGAAASTSFGRSSNTAGYGSMGSLLTDDFSMSQHPADVRTNRAEDIESTFVDDGAMTVTLTAAISETKFLAAFGDGTLIIYNLEKPTCIEINTRDTGPVLDAMKKKKGADAGLAPTGALAAPAAVVNVASNLAKKFKVITKSNNGNRKGTMLQLASQVQNNSIRQKASILVHAYRDAVDIEPGERSTLVQPVINTKFFSTLQPEYVPSQPAMSPRPSFMMSRPSVRSTKSQRSTIIAPAATTATVMELTSAPTPPTQGRGTEVLRNFMAERTQFGSFPISPRMSRLSLAMGSSVVGRGDVVPADIIRATIRLNKRPQTHSSNPVHHEGDHEEEQDEDDEEKDGGDDDGDNGRGELPLPNNDDSGTEPPDSQHSHHHHHHHHHQKQKLAVESKPSNTLRQSRKDSNLDHHGDEDEDKGDDDDGGEGESPRPPEATFKFQELTKAESTQSTKTKRMLRNSIRVPVGADGFGSSTKRLPNPGLPQHGEEKVAPLLAARLANRKASAVAISEGSCAPENGASDATGKATSKKDDGKSDTIDASEIGGRASSNKTSEVAPQNVVSLAAAISGGGHETESAGGMKGRAGSTVAGPPQAPIRGLRKALAGPPQAPIGGLRGALAGMVHASSLPHTPAPVQEAVVGPHIGTDDDDNSLDTSLEGDEGASMPLPPPSTSSPAEVEDVLVNAVLVIRSMGVILGACSDGFIRFWDIYAHIPLCACKYWVDSDMTDQIAKKKGNGKVSAGAKGDKKKVVGTRLRLERLAITTDEGKLIGGYDNGCIRVWDIIAHSLTTLRKVLRVPVAGSDGVSTDPHWKPTASFHANVSSSIGLAISPLQYSHEWSAHSSPILNVDFVSFQFNIIGQDETKTGSTASAVAPESTPMVDPKHGDEAEKKGAHSKLFLAASKLNGVAFDDWIDDEADDGFVVSAGLDQQIFLWTLNGRYVGQFGPFIWDVNDKDSWMTIDDGDDAARNRKGRRKLQSAAGDGAKAGRGRKKTIQEMIEIVDSQRRRIANREPASHRQNALLGSLMSTHAIVTDDILTDTIATSLVKQPDVAQKRTVTNLCGADLTYGRKVQEKLVRLQGKEENRYPPFSGDKGLPPRDGSLHGGTGLLPAAQTLRLKLTNILVAKDKEREKEKEKEGNH